MFYIVDDDQIVFAQDDKGMKLLRDQVSAWEYVPVKITETGMTAQKPSKVGDDVPDSIKSIVCWFGNEPTELTKEEKMVEAMPDHFKLPELDEHAKVAKLMWLQQQAQEQQVVNEERFAL